MHQLKIFNPTIYDIILVINKETSISLSKNVIGAYERLTIGQRTAKLRLVADLAAASNNAIPTNV